ATASPSTPLLRSCCHLQPPQTPKCGQNGSTRCLEGSFKATKRPSAKFFFFRNSSTSAISPGTACSMNSTKSSCLATPLPSSAISIICTSDIDHLSCGILLPIMGAIIRSFVCSFRREKNQNDRRELRDTKKQTLVSKLVATDIFDSG